MYLLVKKNAGNIKFPNRTRTKSFSGTIICYSMSQGPGVLISVATVVNNGFVRIPGWPTKKLLIVFRMRR